MRKPGLLLDIGRTLVYYHLKIWHRLRILGLENFPLTGGVILVSNHISHLDPPGVGSAAPRVPRFVAKEELFRSFFLSWYLPAIGTIPIKRGVGGKYMLDQAAEAVNDGDLVVLFPEGTRSKTGMPSRPKTGMIILAAMTQAPIVPARISGSYDCMPPGRILPKPGLIQVAFGKPISWEPGELDLSNRELIVEKANYVMDTIHNLPGWYPKNAKPAPDETVTSEISTDSDSK